MWNAWISTFQHRYTLPDTTWKQAGLSAHEGCVFSFLLHGVIALRTVHTKVTLLSVKRASIGLLHFPEKGASKNCSIQDRNAMWDSKRQHDLFVLLCAVILIEILYQTLICEVFCLAAASPDEELLRNPAESSIGLADAQVDITRSFQSRFLSGSPWSGSWGMGLRTFSWKKSYENMFMDVSMNTFPGNICARDEAVYSQLVPANCLCPALWSVLLRLKGWSGGLSKLRFS